jgi:hypothetical protein
MLLRGLGKFVAVVVAAGLAGALIGIGLAKLSGNEKTSDPVIPATTTAAAKTTARTQTTPASTATATTPARTTSTPAATTSTTSTSTSTTPVKAVYRVPRVQVLSAQLGPTSQVTGRALIAIRASLTNRGNKPLTIKTPVLVSGADEAPLGDAARNAAGPLLKPIAPGASASGTLRFTVTSVVAQRLAASPAARLRLGNRTVIVKLTPSPPAP